MAYYDINNEKNQDDKEIFHTERSQSNNVWYSLHDG